jgi:nucleotide-binding universal stress UspA family protein
MTQQDEAKWVVVGIDGSQAAIDAARWAVDEALSVNVPLRLVHVIPPTQTPQPRTHSRCDVEQFESDLEYAQAMAETRLRKTSVLLIDRRVDSWIRRYPDVQVRTIAENSRAMRSIENHGDSVQLVIVGNADADSVVQLVDYNCHPVLRYVNAPVHLIRQ